MRKALVALIMFSASLSGDAAPPPPTLWAGISVKEPVYWEDRMEHLQVFFSVVNDGGSAVDPKSESSRLLVNGVELKQWPLIVANGARDSRCNALPPGGVCTFGYALGRHFRKPGVYVLRWEGGLFRSAELTFRVLAARSS